MAPTQTPPTTDNDQSLFHIQRITQYVALPPLALSSPLPALCASIFSPLLLSYYPPARGIILSYSNVQLSEEPPKPRSSKSSSKYAAASTTTSTAPLLMRMVDEYSSPFTWATADLLIWRPAKNAWIEGRITHQASTHITLSYLNAFPVSVLREHMPRGWSYQSAQTNSYSMTGGSRSLSTGGQAAGEGYWVDSEGGMPVGEGPNGTVLRVRIRDWDGKMDVGGEGRKAGAGIGTLRIEGSLLTVEQEKNPAAVTATAELQKREVGRGGRERFVGGCSASRHVKGN
ncbi:hypothetical protein BU24DRAFT_439127 [Aaosphaeria arxii CBS 175.79]|uniref:DNA-directed RNA polymerase subunit n=1 Tax=Aaosphaeria arxii CBS 175.79 TaxID=1450172 RepID=A0A6A5Y034_9PLEO|nr:uncharacterized protein BU24DRAFT_439127 [Aaosphaeria arxii CBS 175.79]KAF2018566.1 hypothetical protein BU24DRAFT_439127 [Aaosphaeria arxii CBS 175.79]